MTLEALSRRIKITSDFRVFVSTMKMLSSVSVGQYEKALNSLTQYGQTIRDAFHGLFSQDSFNYTSFQKTQKTPHILSIIIGTDNGLVGKFNRDLMSFTQQYLQHLYPESELRFIAVGKRIGLLAKAAHLTTDALYPISNSLKEIAPLSSLLLTQINEIVSHHKIDRVYVFAQRKQGNTAFVPRARQIIPLPEDQMKQLKKQKWNGRTLPLITADKNTLLSALIREYLIVVLSHDLTASLASEHFTRMMHMQEAEKNIDESLEAFHLQYQQLRQAQITDELIDIVSGAEEMNKQKNQSPLDFSTKKK